MKKRQKNSGTLSRHAKSPFKDIRLITAIALIVGSMALGGLGYSALASTTPVVVAQAAITEGQPLEASHFRVEEVRIGELSGGYLTDVSQIPEGALATRSIGAGEFVAKSSIGQVESSHLRPLSIEVPSSSASSLAVGAHADVWVAKEGEAGESTAQALVENAVVRAIDTGGGFGTQAARVEVLVPEDSVAALLGAMSAKDELYVVEVPGHFDVTP